MDFNEFIHIHMCTLQKITTTHVTLFCGDERVFLFCECEYDAFANAEM